MNIPTTEPSVTPPKARWTGNFRGARVATAFVAEYPDGSVRLSLGFVGGNDLVLIGNSPVAGRISLRELGAKGETGELGHLSIESYSPAGASGSWQIGQAEGVFELYPVARAHDPGGEVGQAEQPLWNKEQSLGAITLYRPDLVRLIAEMESHIPAPRRALIRAVESGQTIIERADTYLARADFPSVVKEMTITSEELKPGFHKILNAIMADDGSSSVSASSPDELWTLASVQQVTTYLQQFSSRFTDWLRKRGLTVNSFILIAILIWMPDRPLVERIIVFLIGIGLMWGIMKSHSLIPTNRVFLDPDRQKRPFAKEVPGAALAVVAGTVTAFLGTFPELYQWVSQTLPAVLSGLFGPG